MKPTVTEKMILENQRAIMTALMAIAVANGNRRVEMDLTYHVAKITGFIGPEKER